MKINGFKINGFGKLENKDVKLTEGINVVFGENETGKSSMLKFISSMFYGTSKNKNGKEISDFERYKPWKNDEFSGKINYSLDNGETYEVYREFKKKNPIIYNKNKEDISKDFPIDKVRGIDFFKEQTDIDEETFYSTAITEQEGMKLSKSSQSSIIQKISNLISSGDDSISYKRSLEKITRSQNEEVGTDRTSQRPINLVNNKIDRLIEEKRNLEIYRERIDSDILKKQQLEIDLKDKQLKREFLKEVKNKLDVNRVRNAEINFNKNLEKEYTDKIDELNRKISDKRVERKYQQINFNNYYIAILVLVVIFAALMITDPARIINYLFIIPIILITYKVIAEKEKLKHVKDTSSSSKEKIISEINILKENISKQKIVSDEKKEKLEQDIEKEKEEITNKYIKVLDLGYIDKYIDKNYDELLSAIDLEENRMNTIQFKLQSMENNLNLTNEKLDRLSSVEEEIHNCEEEKDELLSLNNAYNIAKRSLESAYMQVKENISPKFTDNLCKIISKISNDRYTNVVLTDQDGLKVELDNGNYISASRLSVGTIDQMYLSLRLSALKEITTEVMPIILDEAFAYFDDERLENILKYLNSNFKENQIIIFTCSRRELDALSRLGIPYNSINL